MSFVPEKGGLATSLIFKSAQGRPRELLYLPENFNIDTYQDISLAWPFCFPFCARISRDGQYGQYLYEGQRYELPIHGFANQESWQVLVHQGNRLTLCLEDNERTRKAYPFAFKVTLDYQIEDGQLVCEQTYHNPGRAPFPYAAGFHPYFQIADKDQTLIQFEAEYRLQYNPTLTDIVGRLPAILSPARLSQPEVNESLHRLGANKRVTLKYPDGFSLWMEVNSSQNPDLFGYLQLYHIPEKPFFCIEPWTSFPNALNTVAGMHWLMPGESHQSTLVLSTYFE